MIQARNTFWSGYPSVQAWYSLLREAPFGLQLAEAREDCHFRLIDFSIANFGFSAAARTKAFSRCGRSAREQTPAREEYAPVAEEDFRFGFPGVPAPSATVNVCRLSAADGTGGYFVGVLPLGSVETAGSGDNTFASPLYSTQRGSTQRSDYLLAENKPKW